MPPIRASYLFPPVVGPANPQPWQENQETAINKTNGWSGAV